MTTAIYLRISSEDIDLKTGEKDESESISNQRRLLRDYVSAHADLSGSEILEFCDDGWSGTNFERPAIKELLEQVKRGKINCIVVKDLSRFGRDYITVGDYISRVFPFLGVRFISVNDGFDSINPQDIDSLATRMKKTREDVIDALAYNYDGYLLWLQYSTTGNNMMGGTTRPMLLIRKHNAVLNGFDHTGAFLRMEENIGSTGTFVEAFKYDTVSNSLKLKFSVNKDGVVSLGQVTIDPASIAGVGRLYFVGEDLKFVTPSGVVRTVKF